MKYKKYPQYKDSGVEWLGKVPPSWLFGSLKRGLVLLTDFEANGSFADVKSNVTLDSDDKYAWYLRATDLENKRKSNKRTCDERSYKFLRKTALYGKELLVAKRGEIGKIYITPTINGKATLAPNLYLLRMNKKLDSKFAYYWYLSDYGRPQLLLADKSTTIGALYKDDVKDCKILYPSFQEQQTIVNYLDKATAKIDTLIEKQTKLIELLKEKRQVVISTAVTHGLDSSVPMKDSGVEWLGEIPEHWICTKIKNMLSIPITDGPHETPEFINEGVPFISAEAISKGYINFNKIRGHISLEDNKKYSQKYSPKLHDVYMIKSGATTGITAIVEEKIDFNIWSPLAVFRANARLNSYYLLNYLRSSNFQKAVELYWSYGTQQNIGMNVLENLHILIPPIEEQNNIANYLDDKTSKIDNLITKATKAIELLKERRTALISAVVTGKIDVRELT